MSKLLLLTALAAMLILTSGCIRSSVRITSDPRGADVFVNDTPRGRTPVEMPIPWYWYYTIRVEKDGFATSEVNERFRAKFWQSFPIGIFAEAFPYPFRDQRSRHYVLEPESVE